MTTIVGFDNHMFPGASIAVGMGAVAEPGQVALGGNGHALVVGGTGVVVDGQPVKLERVVIALKRILGDAPEAFELRSPDAHFKVDSAGFVYVDGQVAGQDPEMMVRVLAFMVKTLCPQAESWIHQVVEQPRTRRNPCYCNTATRVEGGVEYCLTCGREVEPGGA